MKVIYIHTCVLCAHTVQLKNNRPKICMRNMCAQFAHMYLCLCVHAFLMHLISMYELAYCLFIVFILNACC